MNIILMSNSLKKVKLIMTSETFADSKAKADRLANKITENSTLLLMIAIFFFFLNLLIGTYTWTDPVTFNTEFSAYILGSTAGQNNNIIALRNMGGLFTFFEAILNSFVSLAAGLSFAAVCFDEEKHIYFRVVAVAAVCLILYGGLGIF